MTPKQQAAMQQALEALEIMKSYGNNFGYRRNERNPYGLVCDALESLCAALSEPVQEPVACLIGTKGSAFDLPTTKRAYTYAEQPGNEVARLTTSSDDGTFQEFWNIYPRRIGKAAARKVWGRIRDKHEVLQQIAVALQWQMMQESWQDEKFIPHPATYLNQGRWEDEPPKHKDSMSQFFAMAK